MEIVAEKILKIEVDVITKNYNLQRVVDNLRLIESINENNLR